MELKLKTSKNGLKTFEDGNGNTVTIFEDGSFIEATFEGVTHEANGGTYNVYWSRVGSKGKVAKSFEKWISEVKNSL